MASAYPTLKHDGANLPAGGRYPIIGVNTFLSSKGSPTLLPKEVIPAYAEASAGRRATEEEKEAQTCLPQAGPHRGERAAGLR